MKHALAMIGGAFAAFDADGAHGFQHEHATWLLGTSGALLATVGPSAGHIDAGEYGHAAGFSFAQLVLGGAGTLAIMRDAASHEALGAGILGTF